MFKKLQKEVINLKQTLLFILWSDHRIHVTLNELFFSLISEIMSKEKFLRIINKKREEI